MKVHADSLGLRQRVVPAGEVIFREGDPGDFAYIIEAGLVEVTALVDGQRVVLNTMGPGSLLGELALVDGRPRSAQAQAREETLLTLITTDQFAARLADADPIVQLLFAVSMRYLRAEAAHARGHAESVETALQTESQLGSRFRPRTEAALERIRLESDLRIAIAERQFELHFQPIIDLESGRPCGLEALIRWNSPMRGFVRPDLFIGVAEESALILPIGDWVLEESIRVLQHLREQFRIPLFMSINIAARQTEDPTLADKITGMLESRGLERSAIKLEIIERALFESEGARAWGNALADLGLKLALDDFGTGYSSLQYLQEYRFDTLKIDRSFVWGLGNKKNSESLCRTIVDLAASLDMGVVAEGVETTEQAEMLRAMGCQMGQGYHFARPVPLPGVERLLSDWGH